MTAFHFVFTEKPGRAADVAAWLEKNDLKGTENAENAEVIVVIGGDGTMLRAINQFWKLNIPFLGINRGTRGFLLNPIKNETELIELLNPENDFYRVALNLLTAAFYSQNGDSRKSIAFNDVYLKAEHGRVITGRISGEKLPIHRFRSDGIIIATPQGSTAYNLSAGGSILPLGHDILSITTICPMTPPVRAVIGGQIIEVDLENCDAIAFADAERFDNVVRVVVMPNGHQVNLIYAPDYNFESCRYTLE